jgi:predicted house-cleaning noncanonical NTP pyrophosphatase (MazG superfamily)
MTGLYLSEATSPASWIESAVAREEFGPKAAGLMILPRAWTLPFILVSVKRAQSLLAPAPLDTVFAEQLLALAGNHRQIIVRSSVIGETIWDRGKYKSRVVDLTDSDQINRFQTACAEVIDSAINRPCALVLQRYLEPKQRGEFGNLLRISKTRDQWEITTQEQDRATSFRINTQRDAAATPKSSLTAKPRLPRERLFGSIAAWINNELLHGQSARLNIEWISDNTSFYLVQVDEEDPDLIGVNPHQITITPIHRSEGGSGQYIHFADRNAIDYWDKLRVLDELWSPDDPHKPNLFYISLAGLPLTGDKDATDALIKEFERLLGPDYIVVRTSVPRTDNKPVNLPRTPSCLIPTEAAAWCLATRDNIAAKDSNLANYAFITHRYMDSRASAWARAAPDDPMVEIHGLWGLPDALQYCPYDIWEVHLPTENATEYTEYKSNILRCQSDGSWSYVRVKNEVARSLSIAKKEAMDVARRTHDIATRLGKAVHVMWFIGCQDENGQPFNMPWYWTPAHSVVNRDRTRHFPFVVRNRQSLRQLAGANFDKSQYMIVLRPDHQDLFRDNAFQREVADQALAHGMPIDLEGSTLAHAYYQLIDLGCTVIASSEKDHSRVRKNIPFGKLVRDKIPARIAARQELEVTKTVPRTTLQSFLIGKILEEALEVREGDTVDERRIELADLIEIVRALGALDGLTLDEIVVAADRKRDKLGGFDNGKVLLQTGIGGPGQTTINSDPSSAQVLSRTVGPDAVELPFTFFGFSEIDQPRTVQFSGLGVLLEVTLKSDRLSLRLVKQPQQLDLPLNLEIKSESEDGCAATPSKEPRDEK